MNIDQTKGRSGGMAFLPVLLGFIGLVGLAGYQAQRYGAFLHSCYWLNRFIQQHLDAVAGYSSLSAVLGIAAGLLVRYFRGGSHFLTFGLLFCVVVLLWAMFGLSL